MKIKKKFTLIGLKKSKLSHNRKNKRMFTLIELIIVIVVIGILAGMALPKFIGVKRDAQVAAMQRDLDTIEKAVMLYQTNSDDGSYPFKERKIKSITPITDLKDSIYETLETLGDDGSEVYQLDMDLLKPYIQNLKYKNDSYLYSTKSNIAINEEGKIDSEGNIYHLLKNTTGNEDNIDKNDLPFKEISIKSDNNMFGIDSEGNLYGWGGNKNGALGVGAGNEKTDKNGIGYYITPKKVTLGENVKAVKVFAGNNRGFALGDDGNLYGWGDNSYKHIDSQSGIYYYPKKIELPNNVVPKDIVILEKSVCLLSENNELYTWGTNTYGELGIGTLESPFKPTKIELPNGVKPKSIKAGLNFILALGEDGNLYGWGSNSNGQLGDGTTENKLSPTKINLPNNIKVDTLTTGEQHTVIIDTLGDVYSFGWNYYFQLGNNTNKDSSIPTKVELPNGVKAKQLYTGACFSIVIDKNGKLYSWGRDNSGQLGDGDLIQNKKIPVEISIPNDIKISKLYVTNSSVLAFATNGDVYGWGSNSYEIFRDGTTINKPIPTKLEYEIKI